MLPEFYVARAQSMPQFHILCNGNCGQTAHACWALSEKDFKPERGMELGRVPV
jgi:hypothetical protein